MSGLAATEAKQPTSHIYNKFHDNFKNVTEREALVMNSPQRLRI